MEQLFTPRNVLVLAALLLCIGVYGVLARRNLIVMLMSLELMLVAANIVLILFSRLEAGALGPTPAQTLFQAAHSGQVFALMAMTVAAGEVGVGLAILVTLHRRRRTIDVGEVHDLKL